MIADAPVRAAIVASSASRMPLRMSRPGQSSRIHSMSDQFSEGSNWRETHWASVVTPSIPARCPARLPKVLRFPRATLHDHDGLVATSRTLDAVIRGGTLRPFLMSQCRWPSMFRSSVTTSALTPAAFARSIISRTKPRSRITYS